MKLIPALLLIIMPLLLASCGLIPGTHAAPREDAPHAKIYADGEPYLVRIDGETPRLRPGNKVITRLSPGTRTLEFYDRVTDAKTLGDLRTKQGLEMRVKAFLTFQAKAGESYTAHMKISLKNYEFWLTDSSGKIVKKVSAKPYFVENYYLRNTVVY